MSDIDIERLRGAARRVEFNYRSGQLSTGVGVLTVLDAARFLMSLADQGGELVWFKPCEHGWMLCGESVAWPVNPDDPGEEAIQRPCPGGSRMRVWPPTEAD